MDFILSEQEKKIYSDAAEFARKKLNDKFREREQVGEFFREGWRACAEYGVHGLLVPEQYGGCGFSPMAAALVLQGLGYGCEDMGLLFSICAHMLACGVPILQHGSEFLKGKYLRPISDGSVIAANCTSELQAGSDAFSLSTVAVKKEDTYILRGNKSYITNGPIADIFLVYATIGKERGVLGITAFVVERGFKGISVSQNYSKIGLTTSPIGDVFLDECEVPIANRLGKEGEGASIFNLSMQWERACLFACYLGFMERQLEQCTHYGKSRRQFGQPIAKLQAVANKIVDMKIRLEASKLLLYKAIATLEKPNPSSMDIAIAKTFVSEAAIQSSLDAIQVHGAYGVMRESGIERYLRDAIPSAIFSGTSEIQRNIIARALKL